jgi:TIR domain
VTVFVSYSSRDRDAVKSLTQDLQDADEQVWMDQRLAGGEAWWRAILEQIRGCDVFIFALSQNSIQSKPCQAELQYAQALGLPILPVQVGPVDSMQLNPLATVQAIDYRHSTPNAGMRLISALNRERARRQPLPEPLPDEPEVPFEYLIRLYTTIAGPDQLSPRDQATLVAQLQVGLREDGQHEAAAKDIVMLLGKLRDREDVTHRTRADVDAILASIDAESHPPPPIATDITAVESPIVEGAKPASKTAAPTGQTPPPHQDAPPQRATHTPPPATRSKRNWLIALMVVLLIAAAGAVVLRNVLSPKATGAELVLTPATDPGANAFMPPAAPPPPTNTQPPPTLQPHGDDTTVATQPLPGDRDGLYGGTLNNAESDREKMITFLGSNPAQAGAFVDALNTDPTLYWSGGNTLTAADIPTYLRELTPALLRLDTRATNHGFDGTHPTTVQSVFQAGTAVLVDAHGVPRARPYSGTPLTAPIALTGKPKLVGTPWPGYHPGALAEVEPSTATITNFVLVDVVTGHPFNRPAGTTGSNDTPHSQPVAPPQPAPSTPQGPQPTPTTGQGSQLAIDGTYLWQQGNNCGGPSFTTTATITHQGNTLTLVFPSGTATGTLNADGSFSYGGRDMTVRGVFATEGGRTVIRDGVWQDIPPVCGGTVTATKQ